ncbi:MAG: helix-turn-helix transcriptional regulator [Bacteroidota bacterium]
MNPYSLQKLPSDILLETALKHRQRRKELKLSQAELAARSGVSLGSLKRFERSGQISFESLLKLAHVLGRLSEFEKILMPKENMAEVEKLFSHQKDSRP